MTPIDGISAFGHKRHFAAQKPMSALGQKQTYALQQAMSGLHPIATTIALFGMSALGQEWKTSADTNGIRAND
jgi:hypothetical protein